MWTQLDFFCLRHVVALSNRIFCTIQLVFPVLSMTLPKTEHVYQMLRLYTTSNEIISQLNGCTQQTNL